MSGEALERLVRSDSYLEWAFLRWVLSPAVLPGFADRVSPQSTLAVDGHRYRIDFDLVGDLQRLSVELDGYAHHSGRDAFTNDRFRQNDLVASGRRVVRFTYDAIRTDVGRCIAQLQAAMATDPSLARYVDPDPFVEVPTMDPDPDHALDPSPAAPAVRHDPDPSPTTGPADEPNWFERARVAVNRDTLRLCQREAHMALSDFYRTGATNAACVMSVGAGKTALGVLAMASFARRRALVVTPGNVIRGTFVRALDHRAPGNVLYGLSGGPLIPGCRPPTVLTVDRSTGGPVRALDRQQLLDADIVVTNFHSLGQGDDPDDLLGKLDPDDIDMIVVDEAHIAASASYQRLFAHFPRARTLLMSACFQRLDGKPIEADVVYRYRLIDSIVDGNAKNPRVHRFAPDAAATTYELVHPDGRREEIVGRDALLSVLGDDTSLARITARSHEPIRQVMRLTRRLLDAQAALLDPVKPRVLFSALGAAHAEQIAAIANGHGIPTDTLHHTHTTGRIRRTRERFESDSGDLQGIVQLKMLGQGYDFPPICVVVPMRPYGSFPEFYQFVGRGIRVVHHPALTGRVAPDEQVLDIVHHAELGLDDHIDTIYRENDMDPSTAHVDDPLPTTDDVDRAGTTGRDVAERVDAFVLFERGSTASHVVHDTDRVEAHRDERERAAVAQRYAEYAATTPTPVSFDQFLDVMRQLRD